MNRFFKSLAALGVAGYVVLHLLTINLRQKDHLRAWERFAVDFTSPVQYLLTSLSGSVTGSWNHYVAIIGVAKENEDLQKERDRLRAELVRAEEWRSENERLRKMLDLKQTTPLKLLVAKRIAVGASPFERTLRVRRGRIDGVERGMAVIHAQGVVGQVFEVTDQTADILLVIDPSSALDVMSQRSRVRAILRGERLGRLRVEYLRKGEDVVKDDMMVTSGMDAVYPAGLIVGKLKEIDSSGKGLFVTGWVEPLVEFQELEEVAIVLGGGS